MESKYKKIDIKHKFDNMSRLGYEITGKRGGTPQVKDDIGRVGVFIDNSMGCQYSGGDSIMVDAFKGYGERNVRLSSESPVRKSLREISMNWLPNSRLTRKSIILNR